MEMVCELPLPVRWHMVILPWHGTVVRVAATVPVMVGPVVRVMLGWVVPVGTAVMAVRVAVDVPAVIEGTAVMAVRVAVDVPAVVVTPTEGVGHAPPPAPVTVTL
jgi:hypothetical protein